MLDKMQLKWKITLPIVFILFFGILVVVYVIANRYGALVREGNFEKEIEMSKREAEYLKNELSNNYKIAETLIGTLLEYKDAGGSRQSVIPLFDRVLANNADIYAVWCYFNQGEYDGQTDAFGNYVMHAGSATVSDGLYSEAMKTGKPNLSDGTIKKVGDKDLYISTLSLPIKENGRIIGALGMDINVEYIMNYYSQEKIYKTGRIVAISPNKTILYDADRTLFSKPIKEIYSQTSYERIIQSGNQSQPFTLEFVSKIFKGKVRMNLFPEKINENFDDYFIVGTVAPWKEIMVETDTNAMITFIGGLGLLLIVFVTTLVVVDKTSKKLNILNDKLYSSVNTLNNASSQINATSNQIAEGGTQQAAATEETSATMNEAATAVHQTTENTRQAANIAKEASRSADVGVQKMGAMISSMEELSRSSDDIARIIKTIDDIAFQTNILALNAAVEAARAGDAGKGFAVVAEEVRSLAGKSAEAAKNTASIIEQNLNLAKAGVESSTEVGKALEEINSQVNAVSALIDEISGASEEQMKGIEQIKIALSQMEGVTQSNVAISEESAASANELYTQAGELKEIVERLNEIIKGNKR